MKLVVGLGNPGTQYMNTRHNVGFMVLDRIARKLILPSFKNRFHAQTAEARIESQNLLLIKPQTFMNRSGLAAGEAASFYKLPPEDVLVISDDTALPVGSIRLRASGSPGGHNGLADIQRALSSADFPRLRIGIGRPMVNDHPVPQKDYVLSPFSDEQLHDLLPSLDAAASAVESWITQGIDLAMTRFNTPKQTSADSQDNPPTS